MPSRASERPNVVVFFTDQQRWDTTGVHGNPLDLTPNFDRMAVTGTHVANSFTCQPVCGPARASLQTGRYALETGVWRNGIALAEDERTLAHHFRDAGYATGYIDDHQAEPFFLFISYLEPHHQNRVDDFVPPSGWRTPYQNRWVPPDLAALGGSTQQHLAGYYGIVKRLDEALGRLLDALRSLRLDEDTIVLFTSDHGCHFKTRNGEYKRSCHESSIRVPTAIIGPGFNGGGRLRELVSLVDLPPTLLDAVGIDVPDTMQGRSLLPLVHGERDDWPEEVFLQISEAQVGRALRTQRWKYSVVAPQKDGWNDPDGDVYVEASLYDLESDPYELCDLIGYDAYDGVKADLRERLIRRMIAAGETAPTIEPAPTHPSGQRQDLENTTHERIGARGRSR